MPSAASRKQGGEHPWDLEPVAGLDDAPGEAGGGAGAGAVFGDHRPDRARVRPTSSCRSGCRGARRAASAARALGSLLAPWRRKRSIRLWSVERRPSVVFARMGKNATIHARMSSATLIRSKPDPDDDQGRDRDDRRHLQHDGIRIEHHLDDAALREQDRERDAGHYGEHEREHRDAKRGPQRRHQRGKVRDQRGSRSRRAREARIAGPS